MRHLAPIPSPLSHQVREFCHHVLPLVVFLGTATVTVSLWNRHLTGTRVTDPVNARPERVASPRPPHGIHHTPERSLPFRADLPPGTPLPPGDPLDLAILPPSRP